MKSLIQEKQAQYNWVFLSHLIGPKTPFYGGGQEFDSHNVKSMVNGDSCNSSHWSFPNHIGTHIDFPRHFSEVGLGLDDYDSNFFVFENIHVVDISMAGPGIIIGPEMLDLNNAPANMDILLVKTGFGLYRDQPIYWQENPGFNPVLADCLRRNFPAIRVLGFDSISLSSFTQRGVGRKAHKNFLDVERPILPLEDMDMSLIDGSTVVKQLIIAPLQVSGADGSPCTVMAKL